MGFSYKMRLFLTILYKQKSENGIFLLNQAVFDTLRAGIGKWDPFSENVLYPIMVVSRCFANVLKPHPYEPTSKSTGPRGEDVVFSQERL